MRRAFAKALYDIARSDERIVLMTADLGFMVLEDFAAAYPSRFFNVGVAEANMIGLATGLAASGYIPFVYQSQPSPPCEVTSRSGMDRFCTICLSVSSG